MMLGEYSSSLPTHTVQNGRLTSFTDLRQKTNREKLGSFDMEELLWPQPEVKRKV